MMGYQQSFFLEYQRINGDLEALSAVNFQPMNTALVQVVDSQFSQENDMEDNLKGLAEVGGDYIQSLSLVHRKQVHSYPSSDYGDLRVVIALSMFLEGLKCNVAGTEGGLCSSHKNLQLVLLGMLR